MSTADIAAAAAELSNLRNRLLTAGTDVERALFGTSNRGRADALRHALRALDDATDGLLPFAFYTERSIEELLGLSVAVAYARGGDATSAGEALAALYAPAEREAA